ncbi:MAG: flagellar protein FlaG [Methylobacter sp.]|uniref:flagellar protein FlaG n=1 Tax=Methylobacter sp. TaxID=2051955 RepID=UPI002587DBA0|nr:flagellar protein FlaG [Methylobacter sp.]MCL7419406.1 flagellar protein FlaG [Methylobacter sp.]
MMDISNVSSPVANVAKLVAVQNTENQDQALSTEAQKDNLKADSENKVSIIGIDEEKIDRAVADVNEFFQSEQRKLSFSVNKDIGSVVVEVRDVETDEVIRQIPSESVIKLAAQLNELISDTGSVGVLLKEKV